MSPADADAEAVAAVAEAYVWGLPLVTMHRTCAAHGGVGHGMVARDRLATAADRTVVAPNNDTLYASGWFDLRDGDLVVDAGPMDTPDRYWSVMLLDAYTHVTYVCRRLHGSAGTRARVTYDPTDAPPSSDLPTRPRDGTADTAAGPAGPPGTPEGPVAAVPGNGPASSQAPGAAEAALTKGAEGVVDASGAGAAPSGGAAGAGGAAAAGGGAVGAAGAAAGGGSAARGAVDGGAVVAMGTPTVWVLARVLVAGPEDLGAARRAMEAIGVEQASGRRSVRQCDASAARNDPARFLEELQAAVEVDPPAGWHPAAPVGLEGLLRDPPPAEVVAAGVERGKLVVARSGRVDRWGNGWGTRSRGARFGDDVAYRAAFAKVSLAGHLPAENRSYTRPFDGSTAATLRFPAGAEPPVDGFWSLCVYGPDLFLVDNAIGRHSIGDHTPDLRRDPDGGLTIVVGPEPPAGAGNWLPTPPGPCFLALRAYEGRPEVVDATWFPPDLEPLR